MLTLVLTRHGLTDRSEPEQHLGQRIDVSINDAGHRQAEALGRRLASVAFDRVITSPLFRARETAETIVEAAGARRSGGSGGGPIEADPRLREMDYGAWEGRTYAEIEHHDGAYREAWERTPDQLACPGGESGLDVAKRVSAFLADLIEEHRAWHARASFRAATSGMGARTPQPDRPVLAVGHSSTNRVLLCVALGIPVGEFRRRLVQDPVNLTVLRWEPGAAPDEASLLLLNDRAHLVGTGGVPWG